MARLTAVLAGVTVLTLGGGAQAQISLDALSHRNGARAPLPIPPVQRPSARAAEAPPPPHVYSGRDRAYLDQLMRVVAIRQPITPEAVEAVAEFRFEHAGRRVKQDDIHAQNFAGRPIGDGRISVGIEQLPGFGMTVFQWNDRQGWGASQAGDPCIPQASFDQRMNANEWRLQTSPQSVDQRQMAETYVSDAAYLGDGIASTRVVQVNFSTRTGCLISLGASVMRMRAKDAQAVESTNIIVRAAEERARARRP